ncbi:MAG: AbgT family transporter [Brevibacterium sp.]
MGLIFRSLEAVERVGNLLPHPFWLFWVLALILGAISAILAAAGVEVTLPGSDETVVVKSLFTVEGAVMAVESTMENFAGFAPLPVVVSVILGVAVAERSGVLDALLRMTIARLPARWVTFAVAFSAMISHVMFDAAFIVLLPLAALAFKAVGRSPVLGIVVAYASISAGYNASPLVTPSDAIISSLTTAAAQIVDAEYVVTPLANYFWAVASSVILAITVTLVVELVLAKRPGLDADIDPATVEEDARLELTAVEKKGLLAASATLLVLAAVLIAVLAPTDSPFRGEDGGIVDSVILSNIAVVIGFAFMLIGVVHGRIVGTIPNLRAVPDAMANGMSTLGPVLVLFFAIAQFLAYFKWTGIGSVLAVGGADMLRGSGMPPLVILLAIILLVSGLNLIVTSGSAMWSILAPVLVPMLMYIDIPPETTQLVFRIADSCTNAVTPMSGYFVLALGMMQRYRKDAGIGTFMSFTIPLAFVMLTVWIALFIVWYLLGLPIGPGIGIR